MTIKDIAKISGYGLGTVSRVINGHPNVSEKARASVLSVMEEYNFQPNENAKLLKQQSSTSIAIIVRGNQNMLFADIIEQIQSLLLEKEEEPAIINYIDEYENEVEWAIDYCKQRYPKALIFLGGNLDHFEKAFKKIKVPTILLTNHANSLAFNNLSSFSTDDLEGAKTAIKNFVDAGHTKIGIVGGNLSSSQISFRRIQGCMRCFKEHDIFFDLDLQYEPCRYAFEESYEATKKLLHRYPQATAIFALSDVTAIGAMRAIHDMGLSVPEDISVIGYDGITLTRYCNPRLSTIYQNRSLIAEKGVNELLLMIDAYEKKEPYEPVHEFLPYHFLEGDSIKTLL